MAVPASEFSSTETKHKTPQCTLDNAASAKAAPAITFDANDTGGQITHDSSQMPRDPLRQSAGLQTTRANNGSEWKWEVVSVLTFVELNIYNLKSPKQMGQTADHLGHAYKKHAVPASSPTGTQQPNSQNNVLRCVPPTQPTARGSITR